MLQDALHPVLVPAVDVLSSRTKIFKSPHVAASRGDGDLAAVAPDQAALHEVEHFMGLGLGLERVRTLSIGTATAQYQPREGVDDEQAGAVSWLSDGRLILTLISVQQQHVQAMVDDRLGPRYLRLDAEWPQQAGLGIDVATPAGRVC